jgi:hypothetical protein
MRGPCDFSILGWVVIIMSLPLHGVGEPEVMNGSCRLCSLGRPVELRQGLRSGHEWIGALRSSSKPGFSIVSQLIPPTLRPFSPWESGSNGEPPDSFHWRGPSSELSPPSLRDFFDKVAKESVACGYHRIRPGYTLRFPWRACGYSCCPCSTLSHASGWDLLLSASGAASSQ